MDKAALQECGAAFFMVVIEVPNPRNQWLLLLMALNFCFLFRIYSTK